MKHTVEEAAKKYSNDCRNRRRHCEPYCIVDFISGAEWQSKQSPWISVNERLPEENENIIIMCEHGAIFNGTYCNGVWFCMDGYIHDIYKSNPIYSSMSSIPSLWEPVAWMPIPSFDDILEANRDVLERIKDKGD
ncbi:DUF551 domain-containing protein [Phocaeicola vulgatus]|nr:DUF551 domain-containing protein [Phocaeicola vulgatus]